MNYETDKLLPYMFAATKLGERGVIQCMVYARNFTEAKALAARSYKAQLLKQTPSFEIWKSQIKTVRMILGGMPPTVFICPACGAQAISLDMPIHRLHPVYRLLKESFTGRSRIGPYVQGKVIHTGANLWRMYKHEHLNEIGDIVDVWLTPQPVYQIISFFKKEEGWRNHATR